MLIISHVGVFSTFNLADLTSQQRVGVDDQGSCLPGPGTQAVIISSGASVTQQRGEREPIHPPRPRHTPLSQAP